ncbi:methyltransferase [Nocardia sp. AG03]|uniref:methyltransferase n=1 Tax=Nocardia sp. AG03 TaxID=3025312 RepID=UPI0024187ADA|nr:methyltransferase [Nocardia sp. AG03]
MASLATPMALRVAVTLGLPDRLADTPAAAAALAPELAVDPIALELLLGHLATLGIVEPTPAGYRTTAFGAHLGIAEPFTNILLRLDSAAGRAELAFVELAHSIATGQAAYPRRYGQDFWADLADSADLRASFDRQMGLRFLDQAPRLAAGFDWSRFATVVDVGGGRGDLLAAILRAHPRVRGHLVDLAPTAAAAGSGGSRSSRRWPPRMGWSWTRWWI